MNKKNICIITARGGSKRIPRKNIRDFCGHPIISYSIKTAIDSKLFDEVMVSTDDTEIADTAKKHGANVPFMRSSENSNDFATTADVLKEVINEYKKIGMEYDNLCCIYPTAPFITSEILNEAYNKLSTGCYDGVMPVTKFSFPPLRGMVIKNNSLTYKWPEFKNSRSQDLEDIYHDAGLFYFYKTDKFLSSSDDNPINYGAVILPETMVQDIDNEEDWRIAEMKYEILKHR